MLFKTVILIIFFLQFDFIGHCSSNEVYSFSKSFSFIEEDVNHRMHFSLPNRISETDTILTYVDCITERHTCRIVENTYTFSGNASKNERLCRIAFHIRRNTTINHIKVIQFKSDYVIIDWVWRTLEISHTPLRKIEVINKADCTHKNIEFKTEMDDPVNYLVPHLDDNSFDVLYTDFEKCKAGRRRVVYNFNGNIVAGPLCILDDVPSTKLYKEKLGTNVALISENEYFLLDRNGEDWAGFLVRYDNGEVMELFQRHGNDLDVQEKPQISTGQNRVTVCWVPVSENRNNIFCSQVHLFTREVTKLSFDFPYSFNFFQIHNLPNDQLLILTKSSEEVEELSLDNKIRIYDLWKFSNDGSLVGEKMEIQGSPCHKSWTKSQIIINEWNDEVCITFTCRRDIINILDDSINYGQFFFKLQSFAMKCLII